MARVAAGGGAVGVAVLVALVLGFPAASVPGRATPAGAVAAPERVAFHTRLHFGGSRGYGYGYGYRRPRHSFVRRIVRTAFWLSVLHLFFSHGGLSILLWILIIAFVLSLARRRRRSTYR